MNTATANIVIFLRFPSTSVSNFKKYIGNDNDDARIILIIEKTFDIFEIYSKIENFLKNIIIESINIYNISFIYNNNENIIEDYDNNNKSAYSFCIEDLIFKIESECVNKNNRHVKINERKSIYINFLDDDCDTSDKNSLSFSNKIILNYNNTNNNKDTNITNIISLASNILKNCLSS